MGSKEHVLGKDSGAEIRPRAGGINCDEDTFLGTEG